MIFVMVLMQVLGRWEIPVKVVNSYEDKVSIFTDNANGISHVVWCSSASKYLSYIRVYSNGTTSPLESLPWKHPCSPLVSIKGFDDKKTLFLVYQAQREFAPEYKGCANDPKNCHDIYFTESHDEGLTWTTPEAVPRDDMNDKVGREEPQLLVMNNSRLWIFYKRSGSSNGNYSYVVRSPGSSTFSSEKLLPIHVSRVSIAYNDFNGESILSIYHGLWNESEEYRYYTENNGITWNGDEDVSDYCDGDSIFIAPFNSMSTPLHLFMVCKDEEYIDRLKVSTDVGKSWSTFEIPEYTCTNKILAAGNGKNDGYIAYGELSIYYMKLNENRFTRVTTPPVPRSNSCRVLTTSYRHTKFWYWFEVPNYENNTYELWVVWNNLEEEISQ